MSAASDLDVSSWEDFRHCQDMPSCIDRLKLLSECTQAHLRSVLLSEEGTDRKLLDLQHCLTRLLDEKEDCTRLLEVFYIAELTVQELQGTDLVKLIVSLVGSSKAGSREMAGKLVQRWRLEASQYQGQVTFMASAMLQCVQPLLCSETLHLPVNILTSAVAFCVSVVYAHAAL